MKTRLKINDVVINELENAVGKINAEFIVKAVNSHEALVRALKEVMANQTNGRACYKIAEQALKQAGE